MYNFFEKEMKIIQFIQVVFKETNTLNYFAIFHLYAYSFEICMVIRGIRLQPEPALF